MSQEQQQINHNEKCERCVNKDDCQRQYFTLANPCAEFMEMPATPPVDEESQEQQPQAEEQPTPEAFAPDVVIEANKNFVETTSKIIDDVQKLLKKEAFKKAKTVIISKKMSEFPLFNWLISAASKDEKLRPIFSRAYCNDDVEQRCRLHCCNGVRLHVLSNVWSFGFLPNVLYTIVKGSNRIAFVPTLIDGAYPNYEQIISNNAHAVKSLDFPTMGKVAIDYVAGLAYRLAFDKFPIVMGEALAPFAALKHVQYLQSSRGNLVARGRLSEIDFYAVLLARETPENAKYLDSETLDADKDDADSNLDDAQPTDEEINNAVESGVEFSADEESEGEL